MKRRVLDPCCGSRMFWFDKAHPDVVFGDQRSESKTLGDGRELHVRPDVVMDFRELPYPEASFKLVVFDPPHLTRAGNDSWMRAKYGVLNPETWEQDLRQGFAECFRVLEPSGVLIFKWNDLHVKTAKVLTLTDQRPLFGHPSGKKGGTHWVCFMKSHEVANEL